MLLINFKSLYLKNVFEVLKPKHEVGGIMLLEKQDCVSVDIKFP